tara:strand:- start:742 stop:1905 length:1164 start_codon:yes stop_codon:yes gene_type:complete
MPISKINLTSGITGVLPSSNATYSTPRENALPIIINGDCVISQRGTAIADESTSGVYRVDRMGVILSSIGEFRMQQESISSGDAYANGFQKAFRIDCAVADASPAASDQATMSYRMEGNTVQAFKKGTSNAQKATLAFWVKCSKTGTAQVNLIDSDNSRMVSGTYTISSANTWEKKIINFPADTTGVLDNDNGESLTLEWALDAGSNYTTGSVQTSWGSTNNTNRSVNDFALQDNTANDWSITGIQLEVGEFTSTTIPPFQHESFADNLRRCMRYFYKLGGTNNTYKRLSVNFCNPNNRNQSLGLHHLPVPMRTAQTVTIPSASDFTHGYLGGSNACSSVTINNDGALPHNDMLSCLSITGSNAGNDAVILEMTYGSTNTMEVSAEL